MSTFDGFTWTACHHHDEYKPPIKGTKSEQELKKININIHNWTACHSHLYTFDAHIDSTKLNSGH